MNNLDYYVLDKVNTGIIVIDKELDIVIWNGWLERFTGIMKEQTIGKKLTDICPRFAEKANLNILNRALFDGQSRFCSGTLHKTFVPPADASRNNYQQNLQVEPIYIEDERFALIQITDITNHYKRVNQLKNMIKEIGLEYQQIMISEKISKYQALHDALTGLPNRVLFHDRLSNTISHAQRDKQMFAIMFLDLDGFKEINDLYGHQMGDILLQTVVGRLKLYIRESDTLARFGGDEFVVLLPRIKSREDAAIVAGKLIRTFNAPFKMENMNIYITVSIGISIYPDDSDKAENLIKMADLSMYNVKSSGGNAFQFYQE